MQWRLMRVYEVIKDKYNIILIFKNVEGEGKRKIRITISLDHIGRGIIFLL